MIRKGISINRAGVLLATLACVLAAGIPAHAAPAAQKTYPSAEEAVTALVAAAKADDTKALLTILGPDAKSLITSGDPVADKTAREGFVASSEEAHKLVPGSDDEMILQTGKDDWPLPIPLVNTDKGWRFDTAAGKDEMINRRVGKNELTTIQACLAYVDAQRDYYDLNPEGAALPPYAQLIASSKGKKDGLYWDTAEGEPASPMGPVFASARSQGYKPGEGKPEPYHGYYFRILKAQGKNAPGGAYDYVVRGKMIGGFALVAYPAEYGSSGVMTFVVSHEGAVYEKDLGPGTVKVAQAMTTFDPDETWTKVDDDGGEKAAAPAA